jgi:hypothetical protein
MARVHVVIPTHTTRHLEACLAGIAAQETTPASVAITTDGDGADLLACVEAGGRRIGERFPDCVVVHVYRAHTGEARLNQVRNNGLRALESLGRLRDDDGVLVLDGDTVLEPKGVGKHAAAFEAGADVVLAYRVELAEGEAAAGAAWDVGGERARALEQRQVRLERQALVRRVTRGVFGIPKAHKPKMLGGHHGVRVSRLRAVDGYDEVFSRYGFDDDDLALRLYMLRPAVRVRVAVREIVALHLWHATRRPAELTAGGDYEHFRRARRGPRAERGWTTAREQATPVVRVIGGAGRRGSAG